MTKNPYEIRLDVLGMAQKMLSEQYHADHSAFMAKVGSYDLANLNQNSSATLYAAAPKAPTPQDVIEKATELYEFVSRSTVENSSGQRQDGFRPKK